METQILFENDDFIAVEKPVGIATTVERKKEVICLLQRIREEYGIPYMAVHRLDKEVSGALLFAKHAQAHKQLNLKFDRREIKKTYLAVVHGAIRTQTGEINQPIRQFGSGRMGVDPARGKPSLTCFTRVKRTSAYSLLQLQALTGRRHQLRVHLYSIGHPIVGDSHYGDRAIQKQYPRLMLHAHTIELEWNGQDMIRIESKPPEIFYSFFPRA